MMSRHEAQGTKHKARGTRHEAEVCSWQLAIGIILLALLLFCLPVSGQVAWNKQGGVCFRVDDNQPLERFQDFDSIFSKYGFSFSMSLLSEGFVTDPAFTSGIKTLIAKGNEYMDHSPSHQTNYFTVPAPADTAQYSGHTGVDHINWNKICLAWSGVNTGSVVGEGAVNIQGNLVISVQPGEFHDLLQPVYFPNLYLPATGKVYTWYDLKNIHPSNPDTLRLMSFWEEPVDLGTLLNTPCDKLNSYDVTMAPAAKMLLGQRTLDICDALIISRPYSWIQPYGPFPLFTSAEVAGSMGAGLGYTDGATYAGEALKCYNEYNPMGTKQFGMMFGDFKTESYTFQENRSLIANRIVKHDLAIDLNHFVISEAGWPGYLQRVDSLLAWLAASDIPVMIQRTWAAMLYDSVNNPTVNIFPLLQTDLDEDQNPDGYVLQDATVITNDGVPQNDGRSLEITKKGTFFYVDDLGGLEKGVNHCSIYIRGDSGNIVKAIFWFPETGQNVSFDFPVDELT
ncbi:MAG: hypothetical protein V1733_04035 [bacterium]